MRIRVIDLETTGTEPSDKVVEVAAWDYISNQAEIVRSVDNMLVNPEIPIPPMMSAVHHIVDEDVVGSPTWSAALQMVLDDSVDAYCAHNAKFERQWVKTGEGSGSKPWICTYRCALRSWPQAPGHKNQQIRYWLNPPGLDRALAGQTHRAAGDAYVTAHILKCLLIKHSVEQLIEWSNKPGLLPSVTFGKHKGMMWKDVPLSYLQWLTRESDMNEDVIYTAKHWTSEHYRRQGGRTPSATVKPGKML